MEVVVGVVVGQVPGDEPREGRQGVGRPEEQDVEPEEEGGERNADRRGHDQPHRVVRVVVVDAVDDEVEAVAAGELRLPVEDEPVEPVLGQGPDRNTDAEEQDGGADGEPAVDPEPDPGDHNGDEDDRRYGGVDAREEVQEPALEHRRRGRQLGCPLGSHRG